MERALDVLGVRLRVTSDVPDLVESFFTVFGAFESRPEAESAGPGETRVRIDSARERMEVAGERVHLAPGALARVQVYNLLYRTLARAVSGAFLLHAAAVSARGRAFVIAAPAGSGKTSLARALAARDFALMSDDIAPLSTDGTVHPFPRRVGVVPSGEASETDGVTVGTKVFVDPEALGVVVERRALPLGGVVVMNPYPIETIDIPVRVGVLGDGSAIADRVSSEPGVEVVGIERSGAMAIVDLRATGGSACSAVDRAIDACDVDLVFHSRGYGQLKHYAERPTMERISPRHAGVDLLREALNREPSGALLARHGGSVVSALVELTGLLASTPCFRLTPGPIDETAALLRESLPERD